MDQFEKLRSCSFGLNIIVYNEILRRQTIEESLENVFLNTYIKN